MTSPAAWSREMREPAGQLSTWPIVCTPALSRSPSCGSSYFGHASKEPPPYTGGVPPSGASIV